MRLLTVHGMDTRDLQNGCTPLDLCLFASRHKELLQLLIVKGADVNLPDAYGGTILDAALQLKFGSMIQILVDYDADVNAKDQSDRRPLDYAVKMDDQRWAELLKKRGAHQ